MGVLRSAHDTAGEKSAHRPLRNIIIIIIRHAITGHDAVHTFLQSSLMNSIFNNKLLT